MRRALLAAALALAASASYADLQSSASLTNLQFSVVDLDLNDGIAAGFSFASPFTTTHIRGGAWSNPEYNFSLHDDKIGADLSVSASSGGATAEATSGARSLLAAGSASGHLASHFGSDANFFGGGDWNRGVVLNPNTRVIISGDLSLAATVGQAVCDRLCEFAEAAFVLEFGPRDANNQPSGIYYRHVVRAQDSNFGDPVLSASFTDSFSLSLDNNSNGLLFGNAGISAHAAGDRQVWGIPEPETYALMLLGLGALGLRRSRRSARTG